MSNRKKLIKAWKHKKNVSYSDIDKKNVGFLLLVDVQLGREHKAPNKFRQRREYAYQNENLDQIGKIFF